MRHTIALSVLALGVAGCATRSRAPVATSKPLLPLPVHVLAGSKIPVYPVISFTVDSASGWTGALASRREALNRLDSILVAVAHERAPEVDWVNAAAVRKAAAEAPGMLPNPDQLSTSQLQTHALST